MGEGQKEGRKGENVNKGYAADIQKRKINNVQQSSQCFSCEGTLLLFSLAPV